MPGALEGIKVFEVSQIVAGPYCGVNLADLGADVVKVEPPGGEGSRQTGGFMPGESKGFHSLNRGKRSLVMNLQSPEVQALVHRIIAGFDVFVINARPGVPERLRVDYETLKQFRPDLVYFENTGFGRSGPSAKRSGSDAVAQAYSGLMAGDGKVDEFGAPEIISATAPADFQAGLAGAMAICAALFHRERTGRGQLVQTSLLQAGLALQGTRVGKLPVLDAETSDKMYQRVLDVRAAGGSYRDQIEARGSLFDQMGRAAFGALLRRLRGEGRRHHPRSAHAAEPRADAPRPRDRRRPDLRPELRLDGPGEPPPRRRDERPHPLDHAHEDHGRVDRGVRPRGRPRLEGQLPRGDGRRPRRLRRWGTCSTSSTS